jgi:RNA polymerase sigma-70 factor (ECF subfamily)
VVLAARSDSVRRREALEQLCATYWPPIYGYLRRRGKTPADAEDLTQSFFLHLIGSDFLDRPDPAQGRFRGYLVGALKHFLSNHFEREGAQKRGGRVTFLDWSELDPEREFATLGQSQDDPAELFETSWALTLLGRALKRLEEEQAGAGRARQFAVLKPYLSTTPSRGDYDQAALALGTSRTNVAVWVHRLNQRYAELVRLAVAATVQDPAEVNEELRHLLTVLRR